MPIHWEKYEDVDYLYLDYRGCSDLEIMKQTLEFSNMLDRFEDGSLLLIIDTTGLNISYSNYTKIKDVAKQAQPKIRKTSYVGLNKYSRPFFTIYRAFTGSKAVLVDTKREALENIREEIFEYVSH